MSKFYGEKIEKGTYCPRMCELYKRKNVSLKMIFVNFLFVSFLLFTIVNSIFVNIYVMSTVIGPSMQPTLNSTGENNSDTAYLNTFKDVTYGDVTVIYNGSHNVIKRVIAMAGDTVNIIKDPNWDSNDESQKNLEYRIVLNGEILDESSYLNYDLASTKLNEHYYDFNEYKTNNSSLVNTDGSITIPTNEIFVLGDNRLNSRDSSVDGPYDDSTILGKVEIVVKYNTGCIEHFNQKIIGMFEVLFEDIF